MSITLLVEREVTEVELVDVDLTLLGGREEKDCPFCEEPDGFVVSEDRGRAFYCFGCGVSGAVA